MDETAHIGASRPAEPRSPTKVESDLPQRAGSDCGPRAGDAAPRTAPQSADLGGELAEPTPQPPAESAPAEPVAAAAGPAAEPGLREAPAPPQPSTALPEAGEAVAAEAAPAGPAPAETTVLRMGESAPGAAVAPETPPAAPMPHPEVYGEPAAQAAPAPPAAAAVAWTPFIPAASSRPLPDPAPPLTPAWLPRPGSAAAAARERLADLGRAAPYLRLALRGAAILAASLVVTVSALVVLYRWVDPPLSTLMLGQGLAGIEIERTWVPLQRISPHLIKAVVLSEDGGFCRHSGVDWAAIEEAIESDRGGSTITMQVVKNLFLWPSRSYVRKVIEIGLAYLVEALWSKQRILEIYLNIAEWGHGVFGAEAAALAHFNKPASRLTAEEAALLAVALPNPLERTPGAPNLTTGRLASRLLARMRTSRADLSCVPLARTAPRKAPLVPAPRLTL